jgi:hypothetical protein
MSVKGKDKADDDSESVIGRAIPVITVFYAIEQAEQMIKVKESKPFSSNREAFSEYVTLIRFFI